MNYAVLRDKIDGKLVLAYRDVAREIESGHSLSNRFEVVTVLDSATVDEARVVIEIINALKV